MFWRTNLLLCDYFHSVASERDFPALEVRFLDLLLRLPHALGRVGGRDEAEGAPATPGAGHLGVDAAVGGQGNHLVKALVGHSEGGK